VRNLPTIVPPLAHAVLFGLPIVSGPTLDHRIIVRLRGSNLLLSWISAPEFLPSRHASLLLPME
jgi:hypothetical protein